MFNIDEWYEETSGIQENYTCDGCGENTTCISIKSGIISGIFCKDCLILITKECANAIKELSVVRAEDNNDFIQRFFSPDIPVSEDNREKYNQFVKTQCSFCGTQRCDSSEECVKSCLAWKNFVSNQGEIL